MAKIDCITICPKCKKLVEAKDYINPAIIGILDSILPTINCSCGYIGLPVKLSYLDYEKLMKKGE